MIDNYKYSMYNYCIVKRRKKQMRVNWFNKKDSDCVITLSKEDFKDGEFSLNLKLKDYKRTPQKGDLIKFDLGSSLINPNKQFANEYRVLKVDGNRAYVVSMYELNRMGFETSQLFSGSDIDRFIEFGFYPSISEECRKAIACRIVHQDFYTWDIDRYDTKTHASTIDKLRGCHPYGQRFVSLLSYDDILEYFGSKFSTQDIYKTFFKDEKYAKGHSFWIRSACADNSDYCCYVDGNYGEVDFDYYSLSYGVHPAFVINLSKIKYEFVDED